MIRTRDITAYSRLLSRVEKDSSMLISHVSLFAALFVCWQNDGFKIPFSVTRKKLMSISKVASIATYHKCIKELNNRGYIQYQPSYNPGTGSMIYWLYEE